MNPGSKVSSPHSGFVGRFGGKKVRWDLFLFPPHPIFRTADGWALFSCGGLREPGAEAPGFPLSNILTNVLSGPVQRSCTRSPNFRIAASSVGSVGKRSAGTFFFFHLTPSSAQRMVGLFFRAGGYVNPVLKHSGSPFRTF